MLGQYAATFRFRAGLPNRIQITPAGQVLFLRSEARSRLQSLWIWQSSSGEFETLLTAAQLWEGGEAALTPEEAARRERQRQTALGITNFELSDDGQRLLVPLGERLFLYDLAQRHLRELPRGGASPVDPRFSPAGDRLAYVRGGELVVLNLADSSERQLTQSATATRTNGLAEFIAQEEMGRMHGFWWSPDGRQIAYQETDESQVEELSIVDALDPLRPPTRSRYPRAGTANAQVRLGVIDADGGQTVWIDWNREQFPYLAQVVWQPDAPLTLVVEDRRQRTIEVLAADPASGTTTRLLTESDPLWLNLAERVPHWLPGGQRFLWLSEKTGQWQLELRNRDGSLERTLSRAEDHLQSLLDVDGDASLAWVTISPTPRELGLLALPIDAAAPAEHVSLPSDGETTAYFPRRGEIVVVQQSRVGQPARWAIHRRQGAQLGPPLAELPACAERPLTPPRVELVETRTEPPFWAAVVRPSGFQPAVRYPVLVQIYGGPGSQLVGAAQSRYYLAQALAEQGFCVVSMDGRGTARRGRAWERSVAGDLSGPVLNDTVAALDDLTQRYPELDRRRIGVFGWSFGGYLAAQAVIRHPQTFAAGVAGAPVCDWRDYDTHYTERYLGLPSDDVVAYDRSSLLTGAGGLTRPLLIIHGTADDNVLFRHALRLSDALFRAGRPHEFLPLAGKTHVIADAATTELLYRRIVDFFQRTFATPGATGP